SAARAAAISAARPGGGLVLLPATSSLMPSPEGQRGRAATAARNRSAGGSGRGQAGTRGPAAAGSRVASARPHCTGILAAKAFTNCSGGPDGDNTNHENGGRDARFRAD